MKKWLLTGFLLILLIGTISVFANTPTRRLSTAFDNQNTLIMDIQESHSFSFDHSVLSQNDYSFFAWLIDGRLSDLPFDHTFESGNDPSIQAIFYPKDHYVALFLDHEDQFLGLDYVQKGHSANDQAITIPRIPFHVVSKDKWDHPLTINEHTIFRPVHLFNTQYFFEISTQNGSGEGLYKFLSQVPLHASNDSPTHYFAYWTLNDRIISYRRNPMISVTGQHHYEAVYQATPIMPLPLIHLSEGFRIDESNLTYVIHIEIPTGFTQVAQGLLRSTKHPTTTLGYHEGLTDLSSHQEGIIDVQLPFEEGVYYTAFLTVQNAIGETFTVYSHEGLMTHETQVFFGKDEKSNPATTGYPFEAIAVIPHQHHWVLTNAQSVAQTELYQGISEFNVTFRKSGTSNSLRRLYVELMDSHQTVTRFSSETFGNRTGSDPTIYTLSARDLALEGLIQVRIGIDFEGVLERPIELIDFTFSTHEYAGINGHLVQVESTLDLLPDITPKGPFYAPLSEITVYAPESFTHRFVHWMDAVTQTLLSTESIYTFTLLEHKHLIAVYEPVPFYTLSLDANIDVPIEVEPFGTSFKEGTVLELFAPDQPQYQFTHWLNLDTGMIQSTDNPYELDLNASLRLRAIYQQTLTLTAYRVETYLQNIENNEYTLVDSEIIYANHGDLIALNPSRFGFTIETSLSVLTGTVSNETPLVLTIFYDRNIYDVTFYLEGLIHMIQQVKYQGLVSEPQAPSIFGKTFSGWSPSNQGGTFYTFNAPVTANMMLYAIFNGSDEIVYEGYYEGADGLEGQALVTFLRNLITQGYTGITYGDARYFLGFADRDTSVTGMVRLIYDGRLVSPTWDGGITWNREHVWPQSRMGVNVNNSSINIGSDLHNLRACTPSVNSSRGNKNFDWVTTATSYYPGDQDRGDVARILFYMVIRYPQLSLVSGNPTDNTLQIGNLDALLQFHLLDPVDDFERQRNDLIYYGYFDTTVNRFLRQNNRNPFIDHPEFVEKIWGNITLSNGSSVYMALEVTPFQQTSVMVFDVQAHRVIM